MEAFFHSHSSTYTPHTINQSYTPDISRITNQTNITTYHIYISVPYTTYNTQTQSTVFNYKYITHFKTHKNVTHAHIKQTIKCTYTAIVTTYMNTMKINRKTNTSNNTFNRHSISIINQSKMFSNLFILVILKRLLYIN